MAAAVLTSERMGAGSRVKRRRRPSVTQTYLRSTHSYMQRRLLASQSDGYLYLIRTVLRTTTVCVPQTGWVGQHHTIWNPVCQPCLSVYPTLSAQGRHPTYYSFNDFCAVILNTSIGSVYRPRAFQTAGVRSGEKTMYTRSFHHLLHLHSSPRHIVPPGQYRPPDPSVDALEN